MGDRRQIHFEDVGLWFYSHWGGQDMPQDLQQAIANSKDRWDDDCYCLRSIISWMIGDNWKEISGFGLWNTYMDSEHTDFVVNITNNTVQLGNKKWTFQEFIDLKKIEEEE